MTEDTRPRFQGLCLVSTEGHRHMCGYFDPLPPDVRERLRVSRLNLCAACVSDGARAEASLSGKSRPESQHYMRAIDLMEKETP